MPTDTLPPVEHETPERLGPLDMPPTEPSPEADGTPELTPEKPSAVEIAPAPSFSRRDFLTNAASVLLAFGTGVGAGYLAWGRTPPAPATSAAPAAAAPPAQQIQLPSSYALPIVYGALGPQLVKAGAFAFDAFVQVYDEAGQPLTEEQRSIVQNGSEQPVVIDHGNAYFLLNLLWAFGLVNNNPLLRSGPMVSQSEGRVDRFASTGGWSLAQRPIVELYSGSGLVALDETQQARVEEAASAIYRPCCDNPTSFPDCNHGMAMLGLLQLMAARDATVETMLEAAKAVNAFWFPNQSRDLARYYQAQGITEFAAIDAREAVSAERFSGSGYGQVRNWLIASGMLEAPSQSGGGCGV